MSASAQALIAQYAAEYGVPQSLSLAVATRESGLNQNARGAAGEIGVYQLMPATAAMLGVDPTTLQGNIQGGNMYLAQLYAEFGDWAAAVAAYNWGPGNVSNAINAYGPNWLSSAPSSVQDYVDVVTGVSAAQEAANYGAVPSGLAPLNDTAAVPQTVYDLSTDDTSEESEYSDQPTDNALDDSLLWAGLLAAGAGLWFISERL